MEASTGPGQLHMPQELADVIAFLKFATTGSQQGDCGGRHRSQLVGAAGKVLRFQARFLRFQVE